VFFVLILTGFATPATLAEVGNYAQDRVIVSIQQQNGMDSDKSSCTRLSQLNRAFVPDKHQA